MISNDFSSELNCIIGLFCQIPDYSSIKVILFCQSKYGIDVFRGYFKEHAFLRLGKQNFISIHIGFALGHCICNNTGSEPSLCSQFRTCSSKTCGSKVFAGFYIAFLHGFQGHFYYKFFGIWISYLDAWAVFGFG